MRLNPTLPLAAALVLQGGDPVAPGAEVPVRFQGGTPDDLALAELASGLRPGGRLSPTELKRARRAIEATDRFQSVTLSLESPGAVFRLQPWPRLTAVSVQGLPSGVKGVWPEGIRKGSLPGPRRLQEAAARMTAMLQEQGYPDAVVTPQRSPEGTQVTFAVSPGRARVIAHLQVEGAPGPLTVDALAKTLALVPGRSLWTESFRLAALSRFRKRMVQDTRYEAQLELSWLEATSTLVARVQAGPRVTLRLEGRGLTLRRIRRVLPLLQADRYSPDLLDQGDRRILRLLLAEGHLDAEVSHRRTPTQGPAEAPEAVEVTYALRPGPAYVLRGVQFLRNQDLAEDTLHRELTIPRSWWILGDPAATPDLLSGLEERLREVYRQRGYADVSVRQLPPEKRGPDATAVFDIREGAQRFIRHVVLDLPPSQPGTPRLAATLTAWVRSRALEAVTDAERIQPDQGSAMPGGWLRAHPADGVRRFVLTLDEPVPLIRAQLAQVLNLLRQRVLNTGVQRPRLKLSFDPWQDAPAVQIGLEAADVATVGRLVVSGADTTRARAILRELSLRPGDPLDPDGISRTQAALGGLGGFRHIDVSSLSEKTADPGWGEGDLFAQLEERSPWVISHAFGYDKSQGYHLGLGVQRLNLGGMGRTLDLGIRAGDGTIQSPGLRRLFPTGPNPRSVDMYSLGFSDPRADATRVGSWLPRLTRFRVEGAYIHEQRDTFLLRRRRLIQGFDWQKDPAGGSPWQFQAGLRYEHVTVASAIPGIQAEELNAIARMPPRVTIVAPYLQAIRDRRDNPMDPSSGSLFRGRLELANQAWGTSPNSSFVKVDMAQQWYWPLGPRSSWGVVSLGVRVGAARPTDSTAENLPLSERFFAGGPFTHRGVEPDWLGWDVRDRVTVRSTEPPYDPIPNPEDPTRPLTQPVPLGGQGLVLMNLDVRFPIYKRSIWGAFFIDSGQVHRTFFPSPGEPRFRPLRTSAGVGLIVKVGIPIKAEYAWDVKRLLGKPLAPGEQDTRLKNLLLSAGYQF